MRLRRPRPPRLGGLTMNRLLPNVLTMLALCSGMTAIRFAIEERWESAVVAIIIAAILDALDGRTARLLNGQSKFGAELDSLSDVVSFGVAPAMIVYLWSLKVSPSFGWVAALAFSVCMALRLARFNSKLGENDLPAYAYNYFTGVPAPAGASVLLLPMVLDFLVGPHVVDHPIIISLWTGIVALLLVSPMPTFSGKGLRVPHNMIVPVLALVGLLAAALVSAPWLTLLLVGLGYLASIPLSVRQYRRLQSAADRLQNTEEHG